MTAAVKLAREYELIYIMRPTVTTEEAKKVSDRVSEIFANFGSIVTQVDTWGKRKLAYHQPKPQ